MDRPDYEMMYPRHEGASRPVVAINEVIVQRLERDFPVVTEVGTRRFQLGLLGDEVRVFNFWAAASPPPGPPLGSE